MKKWRYEDMKRNITVNELIGLQINDGSGSFEILSFDESKNLFLVNELNYNDNTCEDEKVDRAIELISEKSQKRKEFIPAATGFENGMTSTAPIEVTIGGATIFVQDIERFEKV